MPTSAPSGEHQQDQVEADQLGDAEHDREAEADRGQVVAEPVHGADPSACLSCSAARRRRAAQRPSACWSTSGIPNVVERFCSVSTSSSSPAATTCALAQQQRVGEAGRDLLDVVRRPGPWPASRGPWPARDSVDTRSSRPPRSSPAAGSSSRSSSGSVISARAICTRLRSPSLRVPNVRSARCVDAELREQLRGAVVVEVVVLLAPAADHAVRRGDDDVVHALAARDPLGERGAGEADPGPQLEHVDGAEHLLEDPGDARGRVDLRGGDLEQRGLAGAVGAEDHPALVLLDHPVDRVEQHRLAPPDRHPGELEDGGHGASPYATAAPRPA